MIRQPACTIGINAQTRMKQQKRCRLSAYPLHSTGFSSSAWRPNGGTSSNFQPRKLLVTNGTFPGLRPALEFAHGHYYQDQVSLHAVRNERRKVRLREVLLLLPGADRHSPVQRRSLLLPALPAGLRLLSLRLGGNSPSDPLAQAIGRG